MRKSREKNRGPNLRGAYKRTLQMIISRLTAYGEKWKKWCTVNANTQKKKIIPLRYRDRVLLQQERTGKYTINDLLLNEYSRVIAIPGIWMQTWTQQINKKGKKSVIVRSPESVTPTSTPSFGRESPPVRGVRRLLLTLSCKKLWERASVSDGHGVNTLLLFFFVKIRQPTQLCPNAHQ